MDVWTFAFVLWVLSIAFGTAVGHSRRNALEGFLYPLILGPLGLLLAVAFVKPPREVEPSA